MSVVVSGFVVFSAGACRPAEGVTSPSDQASYTPLPSLDGVTPLRSSDGPLSSRIAGKVVVIDLWATWCEPCRDSIPKVVRLAEAYKGRDIVVSGIHVGAAVDSAQRFAQDAGISYPLYADPQFAFSDRIGSRTVPQLIVVDKHGMIAHRTAELDQRTLDVIRRLVNDESGA